MLEQYFAPPSNKAAIAESDSRVSGIHLLVALALIALLYFATEVFVPITLSVFGFFLLDPVVVWFERKKVARKVSAPILVVCTILSFYCIGWGLYGGVAGIAGEMPQYSRKIRSIVRSYEWKAAEIRKGTESFIPKQEPASDLQRVEVVTQGADGWTTAIMHGVNSAFSIVTEMLLIPILVVFLLLERDYLKTHFRRSLGPEFPLDRVVGETELMVTGYFAGSVVVGLATSLGFYILFTILKLEHRLALSLIAGFFNLVPVFGAVFGALLPGAQALLQFDTFTPILIILGCSGFLHFLVNNIVIPKLIGSKININATAATLGFIFWGWLWGVSGFVLAIPMMALIRIGLSSKASGANWSNLIAENPE